MATFEIKFRMKSEGEHSAEFYSAFLDGLDRAHVVNDISEPDEDGLFTVWLEVDDDQPASAVSRGFEALTEAQRVAATTGEMREPSLHSAELLVAS